MTTRKTTTTPGEGTPPNASLHSHGGQGNRDDIAPSGTPEASSGTQGNQEPTKRDSNTIASSGTTEYLGEASSGTAGAAAAAPHTVTEEASKGKQGTFKGRKDKNASSGTPGSASVAHHVAATQQDNSDISESSGQSLNTNKKKRGTRSASIGTAESRPARRGTGTSSSNKVGINPNKGKGKTTELGTNERAEADMSRNWNRLTQENVESLFPASVLEQEIATQGEHNFNLNSRTRRGDV